MKASSRLEGSDDAYRVIKPREVLRLMQDIQRGQRSVLLTLAPSRKVVTMLLDVDENSGRFLYDCGRKREENEAILSASQIHFSAILRGVSLRFTEPAPVETVFSGAPAFLSPLPLEIHYLQRREHYRAKVRILRPCPCTAQLANRATISLHINDLSLGGVELQSNTISPETLPVGTLLRNAVLDFFERGSWKSRCASSLIEKLKMADCRPISTAVNLSNCQEQGSDSPETCFFAGDASSPPKLADANRSAAKGLHQRRTHLSISANALLAVA